MHGMGQYSIKDRYTYNGQFSNDDIEGTGVCEWLNGKKYEGTWKANKMDGKGVFKWQDGKEYNG